MSSTAEQAAARITEALRPIDNDGQSTGGPNGWSPTAEEIQEWHDYFHEAASPEALKALLAERDELAKDAARLREALMGLVPFVATEVVESCNGNKCREIWCAGCFGQEEASAAIAAAFDALAMARAALTNKDN